MRKIPGILAVLFFSCVAEPCAPPEMVPVARETPQDAPKKELIQLCWEDVELYTDETFTTKLPDDDEDAKTFKKKRPKYEKTVKEEAAKIVGAFGGELVECQNHTLAGSGLKGVDAKADPYHFKIKLAYGGVFVITIYAKVEIYRDGKLIAEFKDERSMNIFRAASREKRKKAIIGFGNKLVQTMIEKIKAHEAKK